jgi:hypothetical protein
MYPFRVSRARTRGERFHPLTSPSPIKGSDPDSCCFKPGHHLGQSEPTSLVQLRPCGILATRFPAFPWRQAFHTT